MRPEKTFLFLLAAGCIIAAAAIFSPGLMKKDLKALLPIPVILTDGTDSLCRSLPPPEPLSGLSDEVVGFVNDQLPSERFAGLHMNDRHRIRVMVFGDSQVEGDRISSMLRKQLQAEYGGTGPGLIQPVMPVAYTRTVDVRVSANWKRYNYLSYQEGSLPHRKLGPFMAVSGFFFPDSVSDMELNAWLRITPSIFADKPAERYDRFRFFYGRLPGSCTMTIASSSGVIATDTLITGEGPYEYNCSLGSVSSLRISFSGKASPEVYGLSIEGDTGAVVDNIPHRGSAGLEFTMVDRGNLAALMSMLDPDLLILHYGLNVVRNVRDDYSYYRKGLERQLALLKELCPRAGIVLMGLTDMADNGPDGLSSFKNIAYIRDAQALAAANSGIIFWDAYKAMGGEGTIIKWTGRSPPLAQKDYTHLTYAGSDSLVKMLINDLLKEGPAAISHDTSGVEEMIIPEMIRAPEADTTVMAPAVILTEDGNLFPGQAGKAMAGAITAGPAARPGRLVESITGLLFYDPESPFIFTNIAFWLFLLILMSGYSLLYRHNFARNLYLFVFSLYFYYKSGGFFLFLLIVSTLTDYTAARLIFRSKTGIVRIIWLVLSLIVNLGMLAYYKYYGFIIETVNRFAGTSLPATDLLAAVSNQLFGTDFDISSVVLPVGISFFTFQTISYTVDVFRGKLEPVRNITDFGFYVSFFPQLVAGPIVRASEFVPQLSTSFSLSRREFSHAMFLIAGGLVKKLMISDFISVNFVDRVFASPELYSALENLFAVYGYGLQIYCDFSGYTDIATGVALLLGFRLPVNFNSPYKAVGLSDFWRRWHISLSRWLKDYLYIPLGGNRKGRLRTGINLIITMGLGGLWHGASGRFLIWGLLHGVGLTVSRMWRSMIPDGKRNRIIVFLGILLTFNFVSFAWIFFRAESNELSLLMIKRIFSGFSLEQVNGLCYSYPLIVVVVMAGYIIHFLPGRVSEAVRGVFVRMPVPVVFVVMTGLAMFLIRIQSAGVQPFIYFRF